MKGWRWRNYKQSPSLNQAQKQRRRRTDLSQSQSNCSPTVNVNVALKHFNTLNLNSFFLSCFVIAVIIIPYFCKSIIWNSVLSLFLKIFQNFTQFTVSKKKDWQLQLRIMTLNYNYRLTAYNINITSYKFACVVGCGWLNYYLSYPILGILSYVLSWLLCVAYTCISLVSINILYNTDQTLCIT